MKKEFITNSIKTQFKKGQVPWNKGTKSIMKPNSGSFKKGHIPWIKGRKHKPKSIEKMRKSQLGKIAPFKGRYHTEEAKQKNREKHLGKIPWNKGIPRRKETLKKISLAKRKNPTKYWLGKKRDQKTRLKIKEARSKQKFPIKDTSIEVKIQNFLKQLGIEFYAHHYVSEIQNAYRCDILIQQLNTIIECDGNYWHGNPSFYPELTEKQKTQRERDRLRTQQLKDRGYNVLRLWEHEIREMNIDQFREKLNLIKMENFK